MSHLELHQSSFKTSLLKLKGNEVMTDVSLTLPDQSAIPCHKVILMAASPFFETMFQSGLKEGAEQDVQVDFADADTIRMVVDFFYTGEIEVTADNVKALVAASEFLCCPHLKAHCEEFLASRVGFVNCVNLYKFSNLFNLGVLLKTTFDLILGHFKDFMEISDYETLTEDELAEVVSNDGLNVENEDVVFEAVIHWVNADLDLRKEVFPRIASLIRFPFCTSSTLNFNMCHNALLLNSGCIQFVNEALRSQYYCCFDVIHNARFVPRCSFKGKRQYLVRLDIAVQDHQWSRRLDYTDQIDANVIDWNNIGKIGIFSSTYDHTSVISPTGIYFGQNGENCYYFASETKQVTEMNWETPRSASAFIDEQIFVFGGCFLSCTNSVKSLNVREENPEWKIEQEMLIALLEPQVVRFANKVYVFCGWNKNREPSKATQEFDPVRGKWRLRCEMPGQCKYTAAVALNDEIFVFGGEERMAYSYDPVGNEWKVLSRPTQVYDYYMTATTWFGKILIGDKNHAEEYDTVKDIWSPCQQLMQGAPDGVIQRRLHTLCF